MGTQIHTDVPVEQIPVDGAASLSLAFEYATTAFRDRVSHIENMRNRALVGLALLSAASAFLTVQGVVERVRPILWLPAIFFALALVACIPPLMSLPVVHPLPLRDLNRHVQELTPEALRALVLRDTASSDELAECLAKATATYTDNGLRFAVMGTSTLALPVVLPSLGLFEAAWLSVLVGLCLLSLIELGRRAIRLSIKTTAN